MSILKKGMLFKKSLISFFVLGLFFSLNVMSLPTFAVDSNFPSQYSSPRVNEKYQLRNGPCWAFASIATLETFLKSKGLSKEKENLSEQHMLSLCNHSPSEIGWHDSKLSGKLFAADGYLTSGYGPVAERDCPYDFEHIKFNPKLLKINPKFLVNGIKRIKGNIDSIKKAISQYGAVCVIIPLQNQNLHAVSIVGWDDTNKTWLVKDSAQNHGNYTWIPYSTEILEASSITDVKNFDTNLKRYQHDEYGATGFFFNGFAPFIVANVFNFEGNEELESITINSSSINSHISLYLAPVSSNGTPTANNSNWQLLHSDYVPYDGYFTFSLKNKIKLNKGKYAIIAKMEQTYKSPFTSIGCIMPHEKLNLGTNTPGKSFLLLSEGFRDVTNIPSCSNIYGFSIKATTRRL